MDWFQRVVVNMFVKKYLAEFLPRLNGYKTLIGIVVFILILVVRIVGGAVAPYLNPVIDMLMPYAAQFFSPEDIDLLAPALITAWGLLSKLKKTKEGAPQVPTLITDK